MGVCWIKIFENNTVTAVIYLYAIINPRDATVTRVSTIGSKTSGPWFNIKMSSYQYRKSHCGDKTVVRSSYLHNGISYTGKMSFLYWIGALSVGTQNKTMNERRACNPNEQRTEAFNSYIQLYTNSQHIKHTVIFIQRSMDLHLIDGRLSDI